MVCGWMNKWMDGWMDRCLHSMFRIRAKPSPKRKYVCIKNSSECIQCIHIHLISFSLIRSCSLIFASFFIHSHVRLLISSTLCFFWIDLTHAYQHMEFWKWWALSKKYQFSPTPPKLDHVQICIGSHFVTTLMSSYSSLVGGLVIFIISTSILMISNALKPIVWRADHFLTLSLLVSILIPFIVIFIFIVSIFLSFHLHL